MIYSLAERRVSLSARTACFVATRFSAPSACLDIIERGVFVYSGNSLAIITP